MRPGGLGGSELVDEARGRTDAVGEVERGLVAHEAGELARSGTDVRFRFRTPRVARAAIGKARPACVFVSTLRTFRASDLTAVRDIRGRQALGAACEFAAHVVRRARLRAHAVDAVEAIRTRVAAAREKVRLAARRFSAVDLCAACREQQEGDCAIRKSIIVVFIRVLLGVLSHVHDHAF
jgi:hypothetical protein